MSERFENIDQLFKEELDNFSPEIPAGVWGNISNRLAAKSSRKVIPLFIKVAASILLFLTSGIIAIFLVLNPKTGLTELSQTNTLEQNVTTTEKSTNPDASLVLKEAVNSDIKNNVKNEKTESDNSGLIAENRALNYSPAQNTSPKTLLHSDGRINKELISLPEANRINGEISHSPAEEVLHVKEVVPEEDFSEYKEIEFTVETSEKNTRWMVGGQAGPQYSHREISSKYTTKELLAKYNSKEDGVFAYAGGVNIEFSPVKRLSVQSGIYYSKTGQQKQAELQQPNNSVPHLQRWNPNFIEKQTATFKVSNSTGNIVFDNVQVPTTTNESNQLDIPKGSITDGASYSDIGSPEAISLSQYFEYIEIPLIARYAIIDRKFGLHLLGGVSTNLLVGNAVYADNQPNEPVGYTEGASRVNYSSTVGFGLGYTMNENLKVTIEPQLKYYLTNQIDNSNIDVRPYTIGIMTGIKYLF